MLRSEDYSFFEEDDFKEALKQYEAMLREERSVYMDAADLTDIAEYYMVKGRREDAMTCINYALSLHPDDPDPLVFLARERMFDGDLDVAQKMCDEIPDQQDREVQFLKAELLLRQGKELDCFRHLINLYDESDEEADLYLHDCIDLIADYFHYEKALEWAQLLCKNHPDYQPAQSLLCEMLIHNTKFEEAIAELERQLDKQPYSRALWRMLAEAHYGLSQYEEADEAIDYALAIDESDVDALITKGNILMQLNRPGEAHDHYTKYLRLRPTNDYAMYLDSTALALLDRLDDALAIVEKALTTHPVPTANTATLLSQKAFLLSRTGHLSSALETLNQYKEHITEAEMPDYHLHRGYIFLENNNEQDAREEFTIALINSDNKEDTLRKIALILFDWQYYDFAAQIFLQLIQNGNAGQPENCLPYLAYCYYGMGKLDDYHHVLPEAIRRNRSLTATLFAQVYPGKAPEEFD
ncbi:MAG: tetratricopeptide repeat protein [Bacteroidaceae bacterium]|nr:tetratricopeptide repeat protein [Bacteroidaceae bacterium]